MNKKKLYWIFQLVGWSFYGSLQIFLYSTLQGLDTDQVLGEIFQVIFSIAATHGLRETIIRGGWLTYGWSRLFPRLLFIILLMGVANYLFLVLFLAITTGFSAIDFNTPLVIQGIFGPAFEYFLWSLAYFIFHYFERYNKSLQLEAAINEFELNNLKSQLNPHFIFNALNSIRALVDENPKKSKIAITQLSHILRNSLLLDKKKTITFSDELETVKNYLALESIRYEERLKVDYDIHPDSVDFNVPPMMVQTLVENGIKHGISRLKNGGHVSVKTLVVNHTLVIQIRNSGQYKKTAEYDEGFGLTNTQKRLELIFGEEATFEIKNEDKKTVLTEITIPETI